MKRRGRVWWFDGVAVRRTHGVCQFSVTPHGLTAKEIGRWSRMSEGCKGRATGRRARQAVNGRGNRVLKNVI